jgi:hypothetical protein
MENHMRFYEAMRAVPKEAQKSFNNGKFSGTDINPMWRIKILTEQFGPCGIGWYTEPVSRHMEQAEDGTTCAFVSINLYIKVDGEWSKPIYGEGGNTFATKTKAGYLSVSDEAFKMAYTDAISNAAKALGCGADIWFEKDRTKYDLQQERAQEGKQPTTQPAAQPTNTAQPAAPAETVDMRIIRLIAQANSCTTADEVMAIYNANTDLWANEKFKEPIIAIGTKLRKAEAKAKEGGAA